MRLMCKNKYWRFPRSLCQVLQCERQASDSDSGPTAENQSAALGPGRDTSDSLSRFTFISKQFWTQLPFLTLFFIVVFIEC